MHQDPGDEESEDIDFAPRIRSNWSLPGIDGKDQIVTSRCGTTRQMEEPGPRSSSSSSSAGKESGLSNVCVVWNHVPEEITLEPTAQSASYKFIMTVDRDLLVAEQEMRTGTYERGGGGVYAM